MTLNKKISVAAIQMISSADLNENFKTAERLVKAASAAGARLVLLPEYWSLMGHSERDKVAQAETLDSGPMQNFMQDIARKHQVCLVGGTIPLQTPNDSDRVFNTSLVYQPDGQRVARYDKIHLFAFAGANEQYNEANTIVAGNSVQSFEAPFGRVGLSICYDLRFPELYRAMPALSLIVVPAAFTYTTGKAHWEILLRARAIENQCYVLAAAQGGHHQNGRRTWGHSMLVNPWGEIETVLPEQEGFVLGNIDLVMLTQVREQLPALQHRLADLNAG